MSRYRLGISLLIACLVHVPLLLPHYSFAPQPAGKKAELTLKLNTASSRPTANTMNTKQQKTLTEISPPSSRKNNVNTTDTRQQKTLTGISSPSSRKNNVNTTEKQSKSVVTHRKQRLNWSLPKNLVAPVEAVESGGVFDSRLRKQLATVRQKALIPENPEIKVTPGRQMGQRLIRVKGHCFSVQDADLLNPDSYQTWSFTRCPPD